MTTIRLRLQGAACAAVLASGVGAAVAGVGAPTVTLAGPATLRLIQQSGAALSSYPSMTMTMTFIVQARSGARQTFTEHGLMTAGGREGTITAQLPVIGRLEMRAVGNTIFVHAGANPSPLLAGRQWVSLTLTGAMRTPLPTPKEGLGVLGLLPGAIGPVQVRGHDTIDGARTTHYRVRIDLAKEAAALPQLFQSGAAQKAATAGLRTFPVDVWIDGQNHVRQTAAEVHLDGSSEAVRVRVAGSYDAVSVVAPPPADTYPAHDITELYQLAWGI